MNDCQNSIGREEDADDTRTQDRDRGDMHISVPDRSRDRTENAGPPRHANESAGGGDSERCTDEVRTTSEPSQSSERTESSIPWRECPQRVETSRWQGAEGDSSISAARASREAFFIPRV